MQIDANTIQAITQQVIKQMAAHSDTAEAELGDKGPCLFESVNDAVIAAYVAQKKLIGLSLEKRGQLISAIRAMARANVEKLARMELDETGFGRYQDKVHKIMLAVEKTPGLEDIQPEVFSGDNGLTLIERRPFGVAGCILPSTAPAATALHNMICMIAAGNSAIISPHPGARRVTLEAVRLIHQAIVEAGGPLNVVVSTYDATMEKAAEIMQHPKVNFLLATGGPAVVKAVLSSGKKGIGAGPGNPPALVDQTADIPKAAQDIVAGCGFENGIQCIGEKEVIVVENVADQLIEEMVKAGGYLLKDKDSVERLTSLVTTENGTPNIKYVGKDAALILKELGIEAHPDTRVILFEAPANHIIVTEEYLMPLLPIVRVQNVYEGVAVAVRAEGGRRHSAIMHSKDVGNLTRFARTIQTTVFVKNGPSYSGVGLNGEGFATMSLAGPTGEGLTSPRTFTRAQRCVLVGDFNLRAAYSEN